MIAMDRITWSLAIAGRWTARILGTLLFLFLLAFLFGEGPPPIGRLALQAKLYWLGLISLYLGLIVAWFWEGWGGALTFLGWCLLSVLERGPQLQLPLSIPAALGLVHLLSWRRLNWPAPSATPAPSRVVLVYALPAAAIFMALCANEIFGMPPLMTPSGPMPAELAGSWQQEDPAIVLTIAPTGSVSGMMDNDPIGQARLIRNRSWFGRLMHWRTDYLIEGTLSGGDRFTAPLTIRGSRIDGSVFLRHKGGVQPPWNLRLTRQ